MCTSVLISNWLLVQVNNYMLMCGFTVYCFFPIYVILLEQYNIENTSKYKVLCYVNMYESRQGQMHSRLLQISQLLAKIKPQ